MKSPRPMVDVTLRHPISGEEARSSVRRYSKPASLVIVRVNASKPYAIVHSSSGTCVRYSTQSLAHARKILAALLAMGEDWALPLAVLQDTDIAQRADQAIRSVA